MKSETQCLLEKRSEAGVFFTTVGWLPSEIAKIGYILRDGFEVKEVWGVRSKETASFQSKTGRNLA